jgi:hypothetical protein
MEAAFDHRGVKEYIAVLRLIEGRSVERVAEGVKKALRVCDRPTAEVVRSFLFGEEAPEAATFRLDRRPHLAGVRVSPPDVSAYGGLMAEMILDPALLNAGGNNDDLMAGEGQA